MSSSSQKEKEPAAMIASPPSASTPPFMQPPNAIPPRRSSTSQQHQYQHHQQQLQSQASTSPPSSTPAAPSPSATSATSTSASTSASASASASSSAPRQQRHHHTSSTASNSSKSANMLKSVPESDWMNNPAATHRPRKPSVTLASVSAVDKTGSLPNPTKDLPLPPQLVLQQQQQQQQQHKQKQLYLSQFSATASPAASVLTTSLQPTPPPDPSRYATEDFNFSARRTWTDEKESIVCGPFDYLNGTRGKEFRTQLISAFNGWLEVPEESLEVITRVVGMLHTASLLVDDVEDSSSLRRGLPVAHNIFGVPQTINSANYIYFMALQELQKLHNPKALVIFAEELCNLHRGQGMDLFWRDTLTCPTEDDYLEMVGHKTGGLFRLGIKLMQAESRSLVDCVPLVNLLGLLFQIQDDYRNLMASEYSQNKGMCEDLTEGKFSFPVIHSIRTSPSNLQLLNILKQKTSDEEVKRYAVAHMEHTGSFAYTREVLEILTARARNLADALDEGKGRSRAIHAILDKLVIN
ncbi:geranylgeranyl pyrophosphate synthetase [Ophiostoma piceae UAMH 11346]|uniref:Geranylgeranyl pyrophosphate synthetase n=1 Tax=Ophiostoma piceae (strain UAMH 11346) TaxID=1262450 RepID=S3D9P3_OPHP1|nr:geranylgeranyl pyrophosphate synthetase [Ophiostoma piceae UAMH 11346]